MEYFLYWDLLCVFASDLIGVLPILRFVVCVCFRSDWSTSYTEICCVCLLPIWLEYFLYWDLLCVFASDLIGVLPILRFVVCVSFQSDWSISYTEICCLCLPPIWLEYFLYWDLLSVLASDLIGVLPILRFVVCVCFRSDWSTSYILRFVVCVCLRSDWTTSWAEMCCLCLLLVFASARSNRPCMKHFNFHVHHYGFQNWPENVIIGKHFRAISYHTEVSAPTDPGVKH